MKVKMKATVRMRTMERVRERVIKIKKKLMIY